METMHLPQFWKFHSMYDDARCRNSVFPLLLTAREEITTAKRRDRYLATALLSSSKPGKHRRDHPEGVRKAILDGACFQRGRFVGDTRKDDARVN
jgi:hypothetical protein